MKDVLGQALTEYYERGSSAKLWVNNRYGRREEMPVKVYFRDMKAMPGLEWTALQQCRGTILDVGAGAGSHAIALQQLGQDVTALDISPLSAALMEKRGVKKVICRDVFQLDPGKQPGSGDGAYDTLLLLMNGIGLAANLDGLRIFLKKARRLLRPGGQLIFDSSNIAYLYNGHPPTTGDYYGEIQYQYEYKRQQSDWFSWLFIDAKTMMKIANEEDWTFEVIADDRHDQYLARCKAR